VTHPTVVHQGLHGFELLVAWHAVIDAVQLPQRDLLHAQHTHAYLRLLDQVFRAAKRHPLVRCRPHLARLRGYHEPRRVWVQSRADELLGDERAVGVCRVYQVHTQLRHQLQRRQALLTVGGFTPDALAGDTHGTVADAVDLEVATQQERPSAARVYVCHLTASTDHRNAFGDAAAHWAGRGSVPA
jgi:hypothetical protein